MNNLTPAMRDALVLAIEDGGYLAAGTSVRKGRVFRVNARTLDGLISRGLAESRFSTEGGMAVTLTPAGCDAADTLKEDR